MNVEVFEFKGAGVRTVEENGEILFIAKDVCDALELNNITEALNGLDDDHLTSVKVKSGGQLREMKALTEPGIYALIFKSRKPEAKAFQNWVTKEVLPTLRKKGVYTTDKGMHTLFEGKPCAKTPKLPQAQQLKEIHAKYSATICLQIIGKSLLMSDEAIEEMLRVEEIEKEKRLEAMPLRKYERAEDPTLEELLDKLEPSDEGFVRVDEMYNIYTLNGGKQIKTNFGKYMKEAGFESECRKINRATTRVYKCVFAENQEN